MKLTHLRTTLTASCIAAATLFSGTLSASPIQANVLVSTSSLAGQHGAVDLAFNPGAGVTQLATATVTLFAGATPDSANSPSNTGDASGTLPGKLTLDNAGGPFNDIFTPVIFGSSFHFLLTLDGPAVETPDPKAAFDSIFTLGLYSTDGNTALVTSDGIIGTLDLVAGSTRTIVTTFPAGAPLTTINVVTPEPATFLLLGTALCIGLLRRRRQHRPI